jgi:tRNA(Ile)-lysidine synthase
VLQAVAVPGTTDIPERQRRLHAALLPGRDFDGLRPRLSRWRAALDADLVASGLELREVRPGDRLRPLGMEGHKKLSDLLIDDKVPRLLRDEHLVVARGDDIVWLTGVRPAHDYRVRGDTERILLLEMSRPCLPKRSATKA